MSRIKNWRGARIYTIGHSTRTLDELVALLRMFDISMLADIRTIPRSRHNPQFNADVLRTALSARAFRYVHLARLGGLRRARKDSFNTGWRNASFRGFADYMLTEDFESGLEELRALTAQDIVALMCAEAVPWRCHRSLVADALTARGAHVEHIVSSRRSTPHHLTPFAEVKSGRITYPGEDVTSGKLSTRAPFHLEATVRVLQRRPANRVESLGAGPLSAGTDERGRSRAGRGGEPRDNRRPGRSALHPEAATPPPRRARGSSRQVRKVLGLELDPEPLQRLAEGERALRRTALALRGMRPPRFADWFETFANVVPFQQLSLDAGLAIVERLVERFGKHLEDGGRRFHAFPTAQAIAESRVAALRECGLSARKAESLRYLARAIESGELSEEKISSMSTDDALRTLIELPGIGPWSAGLVLLRGLGRLDVFPPGDVGAERRLRALMHFGPKASLDRVTERFGDYRGYLYFCGLGGSLLAKGLIHAAPPPAAPRSLSNH